MMTPVPRVRKGQRITAEDNNRVRELLARALNGSGANVMVDSTGIHHRTIPQRGIQVRWGKATGAVTGSAASVTVQPVTDSAGATPTGEANVTLYLLSTRTNGVAVAITTDHVFSFTNLPGMAGSGVLLGMYPQTAGPCATP